MNPRTLFFLACIGPLLAGASQVESKISELDALKRRLQSMQQEFLATQSKRQEAVDELRVTELAVSKAVRQMRVLDAERRQTEYTLDTLGRQIKTTSARIRERQSSLAHALRGGYLRGHDDALKFILNGGDPNQAARDLRYLAHLSRAQHTQVTELRADLSKLAALQRQVLDRTDTLTKLQAERAAEQARLLADQRMREQLLVKLSTQLQQQRREIAGLKRDETALTQLVERLNRLMAEQAARRAKQDREARQHAPQKPRKALGTNTETPVAFRSNHPFSKLKGMLRLPVAGELMNRFGAPREGGGVSWKGLFIRAPQGSVVKAIAAGQVVFADWLRGFGNLIIVDHGEGYMSLYSNNESLYKQVGEGVGPGDAIASVGNSGGQADTGLYFEMRHQSRPINPMSWVK